MDCKTAKSRLPLYAGGDLPSGEMAALEAHLDRCRPCSEDLAEYRESLEGLASLRAEEAPGVPSADLWPAIRARLGPCAPSLPLIDDFIAGDLPEPQADSIRRHLEGCASCRGAADEARSIRAALGSLRDGPAADLPAAEIWAGIREGLARETLMRSAGEAPTRVRRSRLLPGPALRAATALVLGTALGWTVSDRGTFPTKSAAPAGTFRAGDSASAVGPGAIPPVPPPQPAFNSAILEDPSPDFEMEEDRPSTPSPVPAPETDPVPVAWLGVSVRPASPELRAHLGLEAELGLVIQDVADGGPGAIAGLRTADILLRIDGAPVRGEASMTGGPAAPAPGRHALKVLRGGRETELTVDLK